MESSTDSPEPLFTAIASSNSEFQAAYDHAAATIPIFLSHLEQPGDATFSVKLRFRDPVDSERLGEDRFAFIWMTGVHYYPDERVFSATFFEVPVEFSRWHQVGQQLVFEPDEIFDWMVIRDGHLHGGFTVRLARSRIPGSERLTYDSYIGVSIYEPLPS